MPRLAESLVIPVSLVIIENFNNLLTLATDHHGVILCMHGDRAATAIQKLRIFLYVPRGLARVMQRYFDFAFSHFHVFHRRTPYYSPETLGTRILRSLSINGKQRPTRTRTNLLDTMNLNVLVPQIPQKNDADKRPARWPEWDFQALF